MNHTLKAVKKCFGCRCLRIEEEFVYGNKINKSCIKCRNKRKRFREPKIQEPNDDDTIRYIRHQRLFKKLHIEFLDKASKKVHIYNMRHILVDVRDCLIYSDKDFSYRNY